jgi:sulfate transport system ATP-binding protein
VDFPLGTHAEAVESGDAARRVQVLFRPEDVAVRDSAQLAQEAASFPVLGQAVVDQRSFVGSYERLRLRLPALPGVRSIAPVSPFGSDSIWIEATRSQDQARRFPLQPGDSTWVGVRRVHALVHPGMHFLLLTDGASPSRAALLGGELARLAHARMTALAPDAKPWPCDLVVLDAAPRDGVKLVKLAEDALSAGQHHLLLVPPSAPGRAPERWLICVAVGEPGKEDVSFAGRLARHLRAEITILTVLPEAARQDGASPAAAERFLAGSARTLARMEISVATRIRYGGVREEILGQLRDGGHDLLVLGSPLPGRDGEIELKGVVGRLLPELPAVPLLIVRSPEAAS